MLMYFLMLESLALVDILCESDSLSEPLNDADVLVEPDWLVLLDILVESLSDVDVDVDSLWLVGLTCI